jgi:hypothetical protein
VKEIVDAHGGTVRAVSSPQTGTEFIIELPPATAEARARPATATDDKPKRTVRKREAPAG